MTPIHEENITIDPLVLSQFGGSKITVDVLRADKIHIDISGNKWFKLREYIRETADSGKTIVTYGGAWSNHIVAVAAACSLYKLKCIGIIRGEMNPVLTATLQKATGYGMQLKYMDRQSFRSGTVPLKYLSDEYYVIPAGGYGIKGAAGAAGMLAYADLTAYTGIFCAVGTGTMMAGLISVTNDRMITGISVLKNNHSVIDDIRALLPGESINPAINHEYHFGGYAKHNRELTDFMNSCYEQSGIPTDFVYTGKLFYGLCDMIRKGTLDESARILVVHSGGLQGNLSLPNGTLIF